MYHLSARGRGLPRQCAHWLAMTCKNLQGVSVCKDATASPLSLRGAKRRGNPFSLRQYKTKRNTFGEYVRRYEFAQGSANLPGFPAGKTDCRRCAHWCAMTNSAGVRAPRHGCNVPPFRQGTRIATPVCALARNDMQKLARCQRLQGRYSLPPVIARSEATWQSVLLAAVQNEKEYFWRIRKALRIRPRQCQLARLPCGETDCRTSSPQSPPCPAPLGLLSPQRVPLCGAPCTGSQ